MMNSVEPPPMSMTSRGSGDRGSSCATPKNVSRPSSCPLMMSIGNPSVRSASAMNSFALRGDAERIRGDHAHRRRMQARESLAEAREAGQRGVHRGALDPSLVVESGAEAQRLAPGVELVDLVALDAADFEPEAVRSEIDDGQQRVGFALAHATDANREERPDQG